ncbi:MAG: DUF839 domain-containing protein [Polyangiaceae bacterium]
MSFRESIGRRRFIEAGSTGALALGLSQVLAACAARDQGGLDETLASESSALRRGGYGPLVVAGPELMLPRGFRYVLFGHAGTRMSDGNVVPGAPDGMAAFPGGRGRVVLVRNHELSAVESRLASRKAYDPSGGGGVTVSVWDTHGERLLSSHQALRGTIENCNGGPTPRRTFLSCEETTEGFAEGFERPHGYVFEVPADTAREIDARPLTALGRFTHEAAVTDPTTGIVYMTEDNGEPGDGFYRFVPRRADRLHEGGQLEMLAISGAPGFDTSSGLHVGARFDTHWVRIDDADPSDAEERPSAVYEQGIAKGAANFMGLEGACIQGGHVYFTASEAGDAEQGQVWRYTPRGNRGTLTLVYESSDASILNQPDGLVVSPRGGVLLCEDGDGEDEDGGDNFMRGLTPHGEIFDFAKNITPLDLHAYDSEDFPEPGSIGASEFAGACFSPDGRWLFVNVQYPGVTVAITGPWERGWL